MEVELKVDDITAAHKAALKGKRSSRKSNRLKLIFDHEKNVPLKINFELLFLKKITLKFILGDRDELGNWASLSIFKRGLKIGLLCH